MVSVSLITRIVWESASPLKAPASTTNPFFLRLKRLSISIDKSSVASGRSSLSLRISSTGTEVLYSALMSGSVIRDQGPPHLSHEALVVHIQTVRKRSIK